jgi:hypothetical protein
MAATAASTAVVKNILWIVISFISRSFLTVRPCVEARRHAAPCRRRT